MKARILIILFFILAGNRIEAHPVHISVVNLDVISDSEKIDFSVRLYYEDFQILINHRYNTMIDFSKQNRMTSKEQQSVIDYVTTNFKLSAANNEMLKTKFTGWKVEDASVWLFFCADLVENNNELIIQNTLLTDLYNDQINYLILRNADEEVGIEFNKRKVLHRFNL